MTTTSPTTHITNLLTELGVTPTIADRITTHTIHAYTHGQPASPDPLDDLTADMRGLTLELAFALTAACRHTSTSVACPNLGDAADHAAAAVRAALHHTH